MNLTASLTRVRSALRPNQDSGTSTPIQVLIYIVTYAGRGFYAPFIGLYLLSVGFTPIELGLLTGVSALVRLVVSPWINALADRAGAHRKLLGGMIGATGLSTLGVVALLFKPWLWGMFLIRDSTDVPSAALMSQLSMTSYGAGGQGMYGKLRAMGSLGWGLATITAGFFISIGGYALLMVLSGVANLLMLPFLRTFPARTVEKSARPTHTPKRHKAFWLLMAANLCFYMGMNAMIVFSWAYFKDYLGADDAMVGLIAALMGLSEIPWMMVMSRIYKRVPVRKALWIGIVGQAVFFLSMALLTDSALLIVFGIVRGGFYAFQNISLTVMVNQISHPVNAATNQAIAWVTVPGIAAVIMGPFSGWMYDHGLARPLFAISGGLALIGALLLTIGRDWFRQAEERRKRIEAGEGVG
jgi:PPP family 3-phenylpropionic acid transporter